MHQNIGRIPSLFCQDVNFRFIIRVIGNGVLLTDFSKASACLLHDLLIAKLATYGFGCTSLQLIQIFYPIEDKELVRLFTV